jgi:hypothetical protein
MATSEIPLNAIGKFFILSFVLGLKAANITRKRIAQNKLKHLALLLYIELVRPFLPTLSPQNLPVLFQSSKVFHPTEGFLH